MMISRFLKACPYPVNWDGSVSNKNPQTDQSHPAGFTGVPAVVGITAFSDGEMGGDPEVINPGSSRSGDRSLSSGRPFGGADSLDRNMQI